MVQSTSYSSTYPATSVLVLGEEDMLLGDGKYNYWLAERGKTTGQGFTLKLDICPRRIVGVQLKNKGKGLDSIWATKEFIVLGSLDQDGPWEPLVQGQLTDTRFKTASLVNVTFVEPVEIQFLRFDLVSYWGDFGGGLQYFAAIGATTKTSAYSKSE